MRIVLVRHGETEGQSSIRYYGATDIPLSALGREQMQRAAAALDGERFDRVYASALSRSREGAQIVSGRDPIVEPGFNEIDFGEWEGLTESDIRARDPARHAAWSLRPKEFHYPGGESTQTFRARAVAALDSVLASNPVGTLLFVLHKGVIRSVLSNLLQLDPSARNRLAIPLGSIHIVQRAGSAWSAAALDDVAHLGSLASEEA